METRRSVLAVGWHRPGRWKVIVTAPDRQSRVAYEEAARQRRAANLDERLAQVERRLAVLAVENVRLRRRLLRLESARG